MLSGSRVKLRLIIICILLGTIPAILVGAFSFSRGSETIQDKVNESNMRNLVQVQMSVEQLLYTADHVMMQFIETPAVKASLPVEMTGSDFSIFNTVEDAINNLPTYSLGANEICFANLSRGWVINNSGIYKLENYPDSLVLNEFIKKPGSTFWVDELSMHVQVTSDSPSGMDNVCLVKKWPLFISNPSYLAILKIPHSQLSGLISENKNLGQVMIIGEDGHVIAHPDRKEWGKDYNSIVYYQKLAAAGEKTGNFTVQIDAVDYGINYLKSDYNNWTYLSIISLSDLLKDSKAIGWFTFFACLAVITVVYAAAFIISNRIYKPVEKIYNLVAGEQDRKEPVKRRDEFGLIEERINFLLKDNTRLNDQLSIQFDQLKEFFILRLILRGMDQELANQKLKLYGYPVLSAFMCVLVARIDTFDGTIYENNDKDLMLFAINNIVGELLEEIIVLKPVVVEEYQVTIIRIPDDRTREFKEIAYSVTEKVQDTIQAKLNLSVSISISQPIRNYNDIHKGYYECIEALKHQISLGYKAVIFYQDIQELNTLMPIFPDALEKDLLDAVKTSSYEKAKELLHQFINRVFMVEASRYEYQVSLVRLLTDLVLILKESGEFNNIIVNDGSSVYEKLFRLKTAGEIEKWFIREIIAPIIENLEISEKNQYKKVVDKVLNIIQQEFHTELTLEDCAARLNYHPSYIRRILKNEAGIVFSDYLAQYRIDMAKKWLMETDMKISEIADKLKYKNSENFIRFFKKYTGMTPGKYRSASS